MYKYIKTSFKRELLFSFILISVFPLIISSFFMIRIFKLQIDTAEHRKIESQYLFIEDELIDYLDKLYEISKEIIDDDTIVGSLNDENNGDRIEIHQKISAMTNELRRYAQFEIYSSEGVCKYSTNTRTIDTKLPTYWGVLKEAETKKDSFVMQRVRNYTNNDPTTRLKIARIITNQEENKIGYIVVVLNEGTFEYLLDDIQNLRSYIEITDKSLNTIYTRGQKNEDTFGNTIRKRFIKGEDINQLAKEFNIMIYPIDDIGLYLILQREIFFTSDISKTIYNLVIVMIILSLILSVAVSLKFSKELFKPIHKIIDAMHKIEEGDLSTRIESDRIDEFGKLSSSFNDMVYRLKDYMDNKVKQQKQLNESNIKMMQAQLNPHFIYNTLDTIKWIAKENDVKEIVTLVTRLAKILRSSISSDQLTTLREELIIVESYMEIQQLRFDGKFEFSVDMKEHMKNYIIPKLCIQPLVENAIIHGLIDKEKGFIHISIKEEKDMLIINIIDDGCGIDLDTLNALKGKTERRKIRGIGIFNIDRIIKLRYGEEYGLLFRLREGGGTIVSIILPITLQEEDYD